MLPAIIEKLNEWVLFYNTKDFIIDDPIVVPHLFSNPLDVEISGFFAAMFSWGNRSVIISKSKELMQRMDNSPHQFILHHSEADLKQLLGFKHRTFNDTDLLYLVYKLKKLLADHQSIEKILFPNPSDAENAVEVGLTRLNNLIFNDENSVERTRKHISTPSKNAACKRLNMYLRWMVRNDGIVDFGIWKNIKPHQLIIPLDVHVFRVAKILGILNAKTPNWKAAVEFTERLKTLDPTDPSKYDFALFGLGAMYKKSGEIIGF